MNTLVNGWNLSVWKTTSRDRLRQIYLHDTAVLQRRQLRQNIERERGHYPVLGNVHRLRSRCHQGKQETVSHRNAYHHGRVPAEDAHQEEPESPCDRGSVEGHRLAAHGRIHQVHVQDRKKVLGLGGRGDAGDTGHHRQRDSKEAIINNSDVVMLLDQSKFKERFDSIKAILGLTDVDCKKIFTINRLENKEGRSFFREVFIRRGSTSGVYGVEEAARMLYDLHHRTRGEGSVETVQERTPLQPPGSHRSLLPRLGCQRHKQVPAFRPEGECSGACVESEKEG